ncbi:hypothetical protein [Oryzihumus sp.]|uniref:hypothetical protein n=1 Tax=Oryzihumus sp. TaxID=1968903 RepID=UPI002EDA194B
MTDSTTTTNPIGVHALVWVGDTSPDSVAYAVEQTRAAGYDLLELSLHEATNLDVPAAREQLSAAGLRVVCSRGLAFTADVSSDDLAVWRNLWDDGADLARHARAPTDSLLHASRAR